MIIATSERLNARNFFICRYFSFYEQLKHFALSLVEHEKSFITSGPELVIYLHPSVPDMTKLLLIGRYYQILFIGR